MFCDFSLNILCYLFTTCGKNIASILKLVFTVSANIHGFFGAWGMMNMSFLELGE